MEAKTNLAYTLLKRVGVYAVLRRALPAFLTPILFSMNTGHFRSSIAKKSLNSKGSAIPWYTLPAIDFLSTVDFSEQTVLEFGGGQSTIWWAERSSSVFSVESNSEWFDYVNSKLKDFPNVDFFLCRDLIDYVNKPVGKQFDLIIIDGSNRYSCAQTALKVLKEKGAIILDNSECFWGEKGTYRIIELFQNEGFMRVDFYGYAPGVMYPQCTSIFFKDQARIFERLAPPVKATSSYLSRIQTRLHDVLND